MTYRIVENLQGTKLLQSLWFSLEMRMLSYEFQSALVLVEVVLMQTLRFFYECSHDDLTLKVFTIH